MSRPVCIDLFCGYGGWARGFSDAGYRVIGFDVDAMCAPRYIAAGGEFVRMDVRDLGGRDLRALRPRVVVASPPCQEFTRLRFLRKNPPPPDMSLVEAVWRIREETGVRTILENVEGARAFIGPARCHRGPYYLWGDVPPLLPWMNLKPKVGRDWSSMRVRAGDLLPDGTKPRLVAWGRRKRGADAAKERAIIPYPLARALAEACK